MRACSTFWEFFVLSKKKTSNDQNLRNTCIGLNIVQVCVYRESIMNKTKLILGTIVLSSTLLAGCANTKLEQSVADLNTKVDQLATDVGSLRTDVQDAKAEAARANQRLDNMATSYTK